MNSHKGALRKVADPGTELPWSTHGFAGNDPLEEALAPTYSVPSVPCKRSRSPGPTNRRSA
jgi:hypothetical protein